MELVRRLYVEKKPEFAVAAAALEQDIIVNLEISSLTDVRILNRYDVAGLSAAEFALAAEQVFSEPTVDEVYNEKFVFPVEAQVFAIESLPGQYDQRADSAEQCLQLITQQARPQVVTAKIVLLYGDLTSEELRQIQSYCINPVDSRQASLDKPESLARSSEVPTDVATVSGFRTLASSELANMIAELGLAMSLADLVFCQSYFCDEQRDPTVTEIRVLDTYWSDHCRHTTFQTEIVDVHIEQSQLSAPIATAYERYQVGRQAIYGQQQRCVCLMDIALMAMKELKAAGKLTALDESEEINACSFVVPVTVDSHSEDWLVMFKNETHNHPTEIEPFGGAATCLGGAIRDPLSGRSYVYQAMRVSGSGDPRKAVSQTIAGKLPQRKITLGAASGYSSYGNQIGLATGQVTEVYDEGYVAKRMEIGAVIGAAPRRNVVRLKPELGDVVLLVGGRTGRDGCGGATGSSKAHTDVSLASCSAEVQKGNAPTERNIQRFFRNPHVSQMIKRCNDFGAGGVSVAVGELTDSLLINLDKVVKKYDGLDGTELAISESQERMAVVVAPEDVAAFIRYGIQENLEVAEVATVTNNGRLVMMWRGQEIVNLQRQFLDTNGVRQTTTVTVNSPEKRDLFAALLPQTAAALPDIRAAWLANLTDLNVCSQKGLGERFDSTIGRGTVLMPFGGKHQLTPAEGMAATLPVLTGATTVTTLMTHAYHCELAKWSPFHGAVYAVTSAISKIVALGGDATQVYLTLQEYFEKLATDPVKWGKPFSALLGAYWAQTQLGVAAIGGKDSMSGTFNELSVPPTLVAFAVVVADARQIISAELKQSDSWLVYLPMPRDVQFLPDFIALKKVYAKTTAMMRAGLVLSAATVKEGGLAATISRMAFGNNMGVQLTADKPVAGWFQSDYGALLLEIRGNVDLPAAFAGIKYEVIGQTSAAPNICLGQTVIPLEQALMAWSNPLESVFPVCTPQQSDEQVAVALYQGGSIKRRGAAIVKPKVLIPVFPGTNCEVDSAQAFALAGAAPKIIVIRNMRPQDLQESLAELVKQLGSSQILMLPGGFSAGDEPDGSGKFIATLFRNPIVAEAVNEFLCRDSLMLGICNGFQALIKLGLLPYGQIQPLRADFPTLTYNQIGRHVSTYVHTKITSRLSPWFQQVTLGDVHTIAVSHGEGRFVASPRVLETLKKSGQIATQYVDLQGQPSLNGPYNPNASVGAVEAITSADGKILGKMGHSERIGAYVGINVPGNKDQQIFASGVAYFR
jgi:phosphoribosylformylglycinamidine synthase